MKFYMYTVKNLLSGVAGNVFIFNTDGMAAVELAVMASRNAPLDEQQLFLIGEFNPETMEIVSLPPKLVSWDNRRLESPMVVSSAPPAQQITEFAQRTGDIRQ